MDHRLSLSLVVLLGACVQTPRSASDDLTTTLESLGEPTPPESSTTWMDTLEAPAVLAFLNDADTTVEVLDHDVALDSRAATNLIETRNGPDGNFPTGDDNLFDSLAEVDEVVWVGESAILRLIDYVEMIGMEVADDDLLGTYDDVDFTYAEASATVEFVNAATLAFLDEQLGLDIRTATAIVEAQPVRDIAHLSEIYYVGQRTMEDLKDAATTPPSLGASTGELVADARWRISDARHFGDVREVPWLVSDQLVSGFQSNDATIEDLDQVFSRIDDDGVHLARIAGEMSPFAYDWLTFYMDDVESGFIFRAGTVHLIATVDAGTLHYLQ